MRNLISAGALAALALSAVGGSASYGATTSSSDSCGTAAAGPVSTTSIPRPSPSIGGARGQSGTEINLGGRWRRLADSPFASDYPFGGWTGSVALVVDGPSGRTASYTPESDQWTELPSAPVRLNAGNEAPSVWTGDELLLWGNADDGTVGLGFTPSLSQWRVLGDSPLTGRVVSVTWTGGEVVAVADDASSAIYDPHRDCWSPLPPAPVAAGSGVRVYWSGDGVLADSRPVALAFLDARTGSWTRRGSDLLDRAADGGVWTDGGIVVLSVGSRARGIVVDARYDASSQQWQALETTCPISTMNAVWTGALVLTETHAFDPATSSCYRLPLMREGEGDIVKSCG